MGARVTSNALLLCQVSCNRGERVDQVRQSFRTIAVYDTRND